MAKFKPGQIWLTRGDRAPVTIISVGNKGEYPICGALPDGEGTWMFLADGRTVPGQIGDSDLVERVTDPYTVLKMLHNAGGLTLERNPGRAVYDTVEEWLEELDARDVGPHWASDEQKALAIAKNDVWALQWYPTSPVGFYFCAAHDLDVLLTSVVEGNEESY